MATKQPSEAYTFTYDFSSVLLGGATISTVEEIDFEGADTALVNQQESNDSTKVLVRWGGGTDGVAYRTFVRILSTANDAYEIDGVIDVREIGIWSEPVTVDDVKENSNIVRGDQDELVAGFITAAREWVENYTGQILVQREVTEMFDWFPPRLKLYAWPVASDATVTIDYLDGDGASQTLADYRLVMSPRGAALFPDIGATWPNTYRQQSVITATFTAGYAQPSLVPQSLKQAILMLAGHFYENREATSIAVVANEVPFSVMQLCHGYRLPVLG